MVKARKLSDHDIGLLRAINAVEVQARVYYDNEGNRRFGPKRFQNVLEKLYDGGFLEATDETCTPKRGHWMVLTQRATQSIADRSK
jgi:hypothetical protein